MVEKHKQILVDQALALEKRAVAISDADSLEFDACMDGLFRIQDIAETEGWLPEFNRLLLSAPIDK